MANLVKELAKVGEERVYAEEKLQEERMAFEERLAILQEEYDAVIKEKHRILSCFVNTKQSLDPRIIKVQGGVINRSRKLRLITLTETSTTLEIAKTESNNCFITH